MGVGYGAMARKDQSDPPKIMLPRPDSVVPNLAAPKFF